MSTLKALGIGYTYAIVGGVICGVVLGRRNFAHLVFQPFILNSYAIPKIIPFPIFLFIFGLTIDLKVFYSAFSGFFPILIVVMGAVQNVPDTYIAVSRSLRMSRYQLFRHIIFPAILTQLVVGLRLAFSLTFLGVILVELIAAKSGVGFHLRSAMQAFNIESIMSLTVVLMLIAVVGNLFFYGVQQYLHHRWGGEDTDFSV